MYNYNNSGPTRVSVTTADRESLNTANDYNRLTNNEKINVKNRVRSRVQVRGMGIKISVPILK